MGRFLSRNWFDLLVVLSPILFNGAGLLLAILVFPGRERDIVDWVGDTTGYLINMNYIEPWAIPVTAIIAVVLGLAISNPFIRLIVVFIGASAYSGDWFDAAEHVLKDVGGQHPSVFEPHVFVLTLYVSSFVSIIRSLFMQISGKEEPRVSVREMLSERPAESVSSQTSSPPAQN